jgi:hypothetical protein
MQTSRGRGVHSSYSLLTSTLDWGERSASRPGRVLPLGKETQVHIGQEAGWVSELVWAEATWQILCLCRASNPGRPVCSQTLHWLNYPSSLSSNSKFTVFYQKCLINSYIMPLTIRLIFQVHINFVNSVKDNRELQPPEWHMKISWP